MEGYKKGDWTCIKCSCHNFARRNSCFKCGVNKNSTNSGENVKNNETFKRGDWMCEECSGHNFASRKKCYKCGHPKNNTIQDHIAPFISFPTHKNEEEIIPFETKEIKSYKTITSLINPFKYVPPKFKKIPSQPYIPPGDWYCNCCDHFNSFSVDSCVNCGVSFSETFELTKKEVYNKKRKNNENVNEKKKKTKKRKKKKDSKKRDEKKDEESIQKKFEKLNQHLLSVEKKLSNNIDQLRHQTDQLKETKSLTQKEKQQNDGDDDEEKSICAICLDKKPNFAFTPCGHKCLCQDCYPLAKNCKTCYICKSPVRSTIQIFDC